MRRHGRRHRAVRPAVPLLPPPSPASLVPRSSSSRSFRGLSHATPQAVRLKRRDDALENRSKALDCTNQLLLNEANGFVESATLLWTSTRCLQDADARMSPCVQYPSRTQLMAAALSRVWRRCRPTSTAETRVGESQEKRRFHREAKLARRARQDSTEIRNKLWGTSELAPAHIPGRPAPPPHLNGREERRAWQRRERRDRGGEGSLCARSSAWLSERRKPQ